jgi:hypothetical protein
MTADEYLTARCPTGCEAWIPAKAVPAHVDRCPRARWTDLRLPLNEILLTGIDADIAKLVCPEELLLPPTFRPERFRRYGSGLYLATNITAGVVVQSPLTGVTARRWWRACRAATEQGRPRGPLFDAAAFGAFEQELDVADGLISCEICGDDVTAHMIARHQRTNSACRFMADTARVRELWAEGYRDPYSLRHLDVPTTWTKLHSRVAWRRRLFVVPFRLWNAVLLAPEP